jgi:hypothetical protein
MFKRGGFECRPGIGKDAYVGNVRLTLDYGKRRGQRRKRVEYLP